MRRAIRGGLIVGAVVLGGAASAGADPLVVLPPQHDADLRWFGADGTRVSGVAALERIRAADLTVWLAGNQFFAMDRVIGDFQAAHRGIAVGLLTLPPGLLLQAIKAGGLTYEGH